MLMNFNFITTVTILSSNYIFYYNIMSVVYNFKVNIQSKLPHVIILLALVSPLFIETSVLVE
jgi:hypothetical protein